MNLAEYISGYAKKRLVVVDLPDGSNQHELNGVASLRQLLGESKVTGVIHWLLMRDDAEEPTTEDGQFTFYDAREGHASRTEWRLYYTDITILRFVRPGDLLVIAKPRGRAKNELFAYVFPRGSSWERKAEVLFGEFVPTLQASSEDALRARELELAGAFILRMMGIGIQAPVPDIDEVVRTRFPKDVFPTTVEMAVVARQHVGEPGSRTADELLSAWLKAEESIFYALERRIVGAKLDNPRPFADVESFLKYSLSVQNRRKSRMGWSFEHQLHALFTKEGLRFDHPGRTEGKSAPDFLFPGTASYHDQKFDAPKLFMLGAKSTCKDRWRQVLAEADRVYEKHVCTLEPAISEAQTDEMERNRVVLVVPASVRGTFTEAQQEKIWTLSQFIEKIRRSQ